MHFNISEIGYPYQKICIYDITMKLTYTSQYDISKYFNKKTVIDKYQDSASSALHLYFIVAKISIVFCKH